MADATILKNYGNTYDITAKKWVREMTDTELTTYGYKAKAKTSPETKMAKTVAK